MRVTFVTAILPHYRLPFHTEVRKELCAQGIEYNVVYGQPNQREILKGDTAELVWGTQVKNRYLKVGKVEAVWQPALARCFDSDLIVLGQENRLLLNYVLQPMRRLIRPRIALWGHGRNFQTSKTEGMRESWKRLWATQCDWWFGYTEQTRSHIEALGYPKDRITVFNNTIDTRKLSQEVADVSAANVAAWKERLGISGSNVCVYVGGLYHEKRVDFLLSSASLIRQQVPDFELVVIGAGADAHKVQEAAARNPWIKFAGPQFGGAKAEIMSMAKLYLMPGLLGLAVLDAGISGLPIVTTAYPFHSPEVAYLQEGKNAVIVGDWQSESGYAVAVVNLLRGPATRLDDMRRSARSIAGSFSIEEMGRRFSVGAINALKTEKLR